MADEPRITRVKATDPAPRQTKTSSPTVPKKPRTDPQNFLVLGFVRLGRYFQGAWYELKQVRWPTRRATWGLTAAVLLFTAFFVVIILLLDLLFNYLFNLILV